MKFVWTEKSIGTFWDKVSSQPGMKYQYFSLQRGKSIASFLKKNVSLEGTVVDLGCGRGDMINYLSRMGVGCLGLDVSQSSVEAVHSRFASTPSFRGAQWMKDFYHLPLEDGSVDGIILLEVIEHLFPEKIPDLLGQIRRVLKPGGFIFLTTPNRENLEKKSVLCPSCGTHFHPTQHLSSFDKNQMKKICMKAGFKTIRCGPEFFMVDIPIYRQAMRHLVPAVCPSCFNFFKPAPKKWMEWILNCQIQSLIFLGTK